MERLLKNTGRRVTPPSQKVGASNIESLHSGCVDGDNEKVKRLLHEGVPVHTKEYYCKHRETPLHTATRNNRKVIVESLLKHGARIDATDSKGDSPLHFACMNANIELVEILIGQGASVNFTNNARIMPIHEACKAGDTEIVKLLIANGAIVNVVSNHNITPLYVAYEHNKKELLELLMKVGASDFLLPQLHLFCFLGKCDKVSRLLAVGTEVNSKDKNGRTALHVCCQEGFLDIAEKCLQMGANANAKDNRGMTPLHHATAEGHTEIVNLLTMFNAKVNIVDSCGNTALHIACQKGHCGILKVLLQAGVKCNIKNGVGKTALHDTFSSEMTGLLVESGADMNIQDNDNYSGLHIACMRGDIESVQVLLENGAKIDLHSKPWPGYMDSIVNTHQEFNLQNLRKYTLGCTPLYLASFYGFKDIVEALLQYGAGVDIRNTYSKLTALHIAAVTGNVAILELLVKHNIDVDAESQENETALTAVLKRYLNPKQYRDLDTEKVFKISCVLIKAGCKIGILRNAELFNALYQRESCRGDFRVTKLILKAGCGMQRYIHPLILRELVIAHDIGMIKLVAICCYRYDDDALALACAETDNGTELLPECQRIFFQQATLLNRCRAVTRRELALTRSDAANQYGAIQAFSKFKDFVKRKMSVVQRSQDNGLAMAVNQMMEISQEDPKAVASFQIDNLPLPDRMRDFVAFKTENLSEKDRKLAPYISLKRP
jgi:ankyrin repeat protein